MNIKNKIKKIIEKILKSINIKKKYNYKIKNNSKFSDFQINGLINIAKKEKINIINLIYYIKKKLKKYNIFKKIKTKKPGFINIYIKKNILEKIINKYSKKKNFNIKNKKKLTIIIDYSSPNIAKQMHIGHLRSTILGDSISNIYKFLGHKIIKMNHIGDWGIQFSNIITWIKKYNIKKINNINKIENIYKKSHKEFKKNKNFAKKSRKNVIKLQNNNKKIIKIWKKITKITILENQKIYKKLNINLSKKNIFGESFYKNMLPNIIKDLKKKNIAKKDKKAIIVKIKNKIKKILIIKKKDGAYLYSTIDIACIKYRCKKFKPNKIIYFIDSRQKEYIKQIFLISKKAKYINNNTKLIHYYFGIILNKYNKPFKTRKGKNIKLKEIIKKTIKKSKKLISKKYKNLYNKNKIYRISKKIAIGAIKYMDLSKNRINNYIFDYKKILSLKNNTGPYIQYAYTRIISILKKNNTNITKTIKLNKFKIYNNIEFEISKKIINFEEIIKKSYKKGNPHIICNYLYKLTLIFSKFYEKNNINKIKNIKIKKSKLKFISIIGKIIKICLSLLGIPILKNM